MRLIEFYIFRRVATAFIAVMVVLTAVVWTTQALRQLDVVTSKGQTLGLFIQLTGLAIPFLMLLTAPIALVMAMVSVYNTFNGDSELVVMSAAGNSRWQLLKPSLILGVLVTLAMLVVSTWVAPMGLKKVRVLLTQVRADVIATVLQPGRFMSMENGLTVHIRDRLRDGSLQGLVLSDERDPAKSQTYLAATGRIVETADTTLLVMRNGSMQRFDRRDGEMSIVQFDAYAFDLTSMLPNNVSATFRPSERTVFELMNPDPDDSYAIANADRFRVEMHDRFAQPLYPLALVLIGFLFVGDPQTLRQGRTASIMGAIVVIGAVRFLGFVATTLSVRFPIFTLAMYGIPLGASAIALWMILTNRTVHVHERIAAEVTDWIKKFNTARGQKALAARGQAAP
ncbi:LPS export ABC transporter permease LptF [Amorphus orientalis]|uniref:Lipopolysaccharide export system permease protein n=1 Tax=Amorphus orientalis TaxID=649198 RepID=A0AAE4ASU2_9HYPH|nr:LPS export ABC transporter permease LptF [Amorphus orientalis]MDQ0315628.1 lipopolysaccharide export system permease protein [Amorphus orientalis]